MIRKILEEINKDRGFVSLNELAERLDMDPGALSGIVQTLALDRNCDLKIETGISHCPYTACHACSLRYMLSETVCVCQRRPGRSQNNHLS